MFISFCLECEIFVSTLKDTHLELNRIASYCNNTRENTIAGLPDVPQTQDI